MQRPIGVTIIAGMLLFRGIISIGAAALVSGQGLGLSDIDPITQLVSDSRQAIAIQLVFASLGIVTAVGGLQGKAWAWTLGVALGTAKLFVLGAAFNLLADAGHSTAIGENVVRATAVAAAMGYGLRTPVVRFMNISREQFPLRLMAAVGVGSTMGAAIAVWMNGPA